MQYWAALGKGIAKESTFEIHIFSTFKYLKFFLLDSAVVLGIFVVYINEAPS